jgi:hypothetical protein
MEAYEFQARVAPDGRLVVPEAFIPKLLQQPVVRVIVLLGEPPGMYQDRAWSRLTAEQFLAGYSDADAIYDQPD